MGRRVKWDVRNDIDIGIKRMVADDTEIYGRVGTSPCTEAPTKDCEALSDRSDE